jgi:hypothetical protein
MASYACGYLIGALFNLALWAGLFLGRKDLRREMAEMSLWAALLGLSHEWLLWTRDWWHPPTLTGTAVGFEDLIYAVSTGGVLAAGYAAASGKVLRADRPAPAWPARLLPLAVDFVTPLVLVPLLGLHSFVACGLGVLLALAWILGRRPDLIPTALASAALGTVVALPGYWLLEALLPGFIAAVWDLPHLSGILLAGIPVEDLAWYAYAAALFGVYYKYAGGLHLVRPRPELASLPAAQAGAGPATRFLSQTAPAPPYARERQA